MTLTTPTNGAHTMYKLVNDRYGEPLTVESITEFMTLTYSCFGDFPEIAFEEMNGDVYFEGPDGPELTLEFIH